MPELTYCNLWPLEQLPTLWMFAQIHLGIRWYTEHHEAGQVCENTLLCHGSYPVIEVIQANSLILSFALQEVLVVSLNFRIVGWCGSNNLPGSGSIQHVSNDAEQKAQWQIPARGWASFFLLAWRTTGTILKEFQGCSSLQYIFPSCYQESS